MAQQEACKGEKTAGAMEALQTTPSQRCYYNCEFASAMHGSFILTSSTSSTVLLEIAYRMTSLPPKPPRTPTSESDQIRHLSTVVSYFTDQQQACDFVTKHICTHVVHHELQHVRYHATYHSIFLLLHVCLSANERLLSGSDVTSAFESTT